MGIKTATTSRYRHSALSLKNLPTTWGLRPLSAWVCLRASTALKNLPTTWGLRPNALSRNSGWISPSEKPPHHMGIKTAQFDQ